MYRESMDKNFNQNLSTYAHATFVYFTGYVGRTELASLATVSILRTQSVCYAFESNALLCVRRAHLFSRTKISLSVHWHFMTSSLTESQIRKSIVM